MTRAGVMARAGLMVIALQAAVAASPLADPGAWMLEVRFSNDARRPIRSNCVFTASGDVYRLESSGLAVPDPARTEGNQADAATILAPYRGQPVAERLSPGTIARLRPIEALLVAARSGRVHAHQSAYDAGETNWLGWVRQADGHFRKLILRGAGDRAITNDAPAAAKLLTIIDGQPQLACLPQRPTPATPQETKP